MRKIIYILGILFMLFITGCSQQENYDIIGDSVIIDDSNLFMNVTPHTLYNSGWVELEFESKVFSGDIDFVFGFEDDGVIPLKAELYNPHEEQVNYTCNYEFTYTTDPNYFICYYNVPADGNSTSYNVTIFEHSFDGGNLGSKTAWWNEINNWTDWRPENYLDYDFIGMNRWYYTRNQNINANQIYRIRYYLKVPYEEESKYALAIKPSSETIQEAINLAHFYYLDPWIDYNLDDGLISYYALDTADFSDTDNITDLIERNNLTGINSPTYNINGISKEAILFNGINEYLSAPDSASLDTPSTQMTISLWINRTGIGTAQTIISRQAGGSDNTWFMDFLSGNTIRMSFTDESSNEREFSTTATLTDTGSFHNIVATINESNITIWLDGENQAGSSSGPATSIRTSSSADLNIGRSENDGRYLNATLDEIAIWNRTLTDEEITALWNSGTGLFYKSGIDIYNLSLEPKPAYFNNTLNCSGVVSTSLGEDFNATFYWFNSTTLVQSDEFNNQDNGTLLFSELSSSVRANESWKCNLTSFSYNDTNITTSKVDTITISNYAPSIPTGLYPDDGYNVLSENLTLVCENSTDPEGQTLYYLFYNTSSTPALLQNSTSTNYTWINITSGTTEKWNCRAFDGFNYSNYTDNRTFSKPSIINVSTICPAGYNTSLYFNFSDEINFSVLTEDRVDYVIEYGNSENNSLLSIYGRLTNIDNLSICVNSSFDYYYLGNAEIKYFEDGYTDRSFYLFQNSRLTNVTSVNTLFSLPSDKATSFLFEFRDSSFNLYKNKYVALLRWYPNLNEYRVVDMGKTDDKGQSIMRVKVEDTDYRVALYELNGTLIKLLSPVRFACLESPCSYTAIVQETATDYTTFDNIQTSITYNNETGIWTFTWNDPSQASQTMSLNVYSLRGDAVDLICSSNSSSYTGVLTCNTSEYSGTLRAVAYRSASPSRPIAEKIVNTISHIFQNTTGLIFSFIIFIVMILIGIVSPIISIILGIVALIPAYYIGSISLVIFIGLAFIGVIVIHFMKRVG